jgi:hypothetical protein
VTTLQALPALEVLDGYAPDEIPAEVFESDVPLVLKGLVSEWPAVKACSESILGAATYINGFWSGQDVTVYLAESDANGRFFYNDDFTGFNFKAGTAPLNLVFQKLAEQAGEDSPQAIYVGSTNVDRWLPGFRSQNDIAVNGDDLLVSFWMGNQTRVSAHFDFPDNVACVVAGRRRFTLFPPEQSRSAWSTFRNRITSASRDSRKRWRRLTATNSGPATQYSFPACGGTMWSHWTRSTCWSTIGGVRRPRLWEHRRLHY